MGEKKSDGDKDKKGLKLWSEISLADYAPDHDALRRVLLGGKDDHPAKPAGPFGPAQPVPGER